MTPDELSPQVVQLQKEIAELKIQKDASRAEFVLQTDKQIARVAELDKEIAEKEAKLEEAKNFLDVVFPAERAKFVEVQTKASSELSRLQATQAEIARKEGELAKGFEKLAQDKIALDAQQASLNLSHENLDKREKELNKIEEAQKTLKTALGIK